MQQSEAQNLLTAHCFRFTLFSLLLPPPGFSWAGFPGVDTEFEIAAGYLEPARGVRTQLPTPIPLPAQPPLICENFVAP